ncbi:hypothetical protein COU05_01855 [bacterium (Candidatus Gribaldobacteria) CG10_big_fil_rev_8_21_14_0_10_37_21]|uniref:Transcription regulator TrmB N-terminal domain-containing protein n=1 Tax=bacterium (Candidatus Gribaldobacteria) CG10_big_fil_rev_8_21_14_0_10_37_21 TaxID=2014275 RepID=A0A2H0UUH7_9BACT|nr:MAG: hypothetical protein AUJ25_00055 [Parcubacteria group bacterium CG1_02_37_13]PIR90481.1 MAG: hypothetical protein COU05_01855 [bacterium (Candidatus Gribaldobacteria) CG10_big_fil_rev_8_21_14_0_10_37_21]
MLNKKQLTSIGFSDKQAVVYLALLELGPSAVSEISRRAGINRTTGYDILEMLVSEGLVSPLGKSKKQKYVAENPEKIVGFAENQIKKAQAILLEAKKLAPELKSIYRKKERPIVKFYEGKEGIKQVFEDTLTAKSEIVGYACAEPMQKSIPEFYFEYLPQRIAKGIKARGIMPDTSFMHKIVKNDRKELRQSRLVAKEKLDLEIEINIYDNKVMMVSWAENLGILIESEKIAKAQKQIFELAWQATGIIKQKT